jgi:radical SAM protein with 4Fe4S-binding SPASM domain
VVRPRKEKTPKIQKNTEKRYEIPQLGYNPTSYSIEEIAASAELTQEFTDGVCLHPQRFLNDEGCDNCPLYANCAAHCKTLSKRKQRELAKARR